MPENKKGMNFMKIDLNFNFSNEWYKNTVYELLEKYPFLSVRSIGKSVMGEDILCLIAGYGEKKVFINGAHHANEWITTPLILNFLDNYLNAYKTGGKIYSYDVRELFMSATIFLVPLVNPDGAELVCGNIEKESSWFENACKIASSYPSVNFPDGWKANIEGVDLNLNYPALWTKAKEVKGKMGICSPSPRDFAGDYPLCAPEARAIYDFSLQNSFDMTLSYHTQGKVIYWKYLDFETPGAQMIAQELSRVSGYKAEIVPTESGYAGYKDWFISCYNRPSYTIEAGEGESPLPLSQFDEILDSNMRLILCALSLV